MCDFFRNFNVLFLSCGFFLCCGPIANAQSSVSFVENKNQWPDDVHFMSSIPGGKMVVGPASFKYFFLDYGKLNRLHHQAHERQPDGALDDHTVNSHAVFVNFVGGNANVRPEAFGRSDEYYNYFIGDDPDRWASQAHGYEGLLYQCLYPGIDLKVYAAGEDVKYDFNVAPGADPSYIRVRYKGADKLFLHNGDLYITTPLAEIIEKKPQAWQYINGGKVEVACSFELQGNLLSFVFPEGFDPCHELLIDPLLIFSTYSGSTADNWGSTATPGERGNLYSAGVTEQSAGGTFPATPGAFQTTSGGVYDIGILKYDSLGRDLLFATYLGGSASESPHSLVMNDAGELIVLGTTSSPDFATTAGAFDRSFNGGPALDYVVGYSYSGGSDIVISRFSSDGTTLLASTFLGGTSNDGLNPLNGALTRNYGDQIRGDVITDPLGNVYVSSVTSSFDFPVVNGFELAYQGGATDAILFSMDPELSEIRWGTYIGGNGTDAAHTLKVDASGDLLLAGGTTSNDFPVTATAYQAAYQGGTDGWIARIASDGSSVLAATFTGTQHYNQIYFLDINDASEVYVYGQTTGTFPVTPVGVYSNPGSGQFVQKFDSTLSSLQFSTVFGAGRGEPDISPTAFMVNDCNNLYMAGWGGVINSLAGFWDTGTVGMETTPDAFQSTTSGSDFYFIVLTNDATEMLYATFLGGTESRTHVDGGTSRFDKSGIVYHSVCSGCVLQNGSGQPSSDFPTTEGAWSNTNRSNNCNNAAFKFDLSSLKARLQTDRTVVCIPEAIIFENISTGGEIFEWDMGDGTHITRTDTAFISHQYKHPGRYLVKLKAIDAGTCQGVDSTSVTVTVNIAQSVVQDNADVCFGDGYELQASGAVRYSWTSDDGMFWSHEPTPIVAPRDTTTYYITLTEANGCIRKDTVQLNVVPAISPEFEWNNISDCVSRPRVAVRNLTDSLRLGDHLFFDFGDGSTSDLDEDEHSFDRDGLYNIRLVSQREFCVFEKSVTIPVFTLFIPNVITPGAPQYNDVFTIRYGEGNDATPGDYGLNAAISIYNRWGRLVYQSDNYQYDWSGHDLAAGTYYYEVSIDGHVTCKSWLHLVK